MLTYFGELAKKFKPPTLWCNYSMLRSTMCINDQIKRENFKQLATFLKQVSSGYQGKKSKVFSALEMKMFSEIARDHQYLVTKVNLFSKILIYLQIFFIYKSILFTNLYTYKFYFIYKLMYKILGRTDFWHKRSMP